MVDDMVLNPSGAKARNIIMGIQLLIESGGLFFLSSFQCWGAVIVDSGLEGSYYEAFRDNCKEYARELFSHDPASIGQERKQELLSILAAMCCGRITGLPEIWRRARRPLLLSETDGKGIWHAMLKEAVIAIDSTAEVDLRMYEHMLQNFLDFTFRLCGTLPTGNIDTANKVLLSLTELSPRVKEYLRAGFATNASEIFRHRWLLHHGNKYTQDILENSVGVSPNFIHSQWMRYATLMLTGPQQITTLRLHINASAAVDRTVLNWQLHWLAGFRGDTRYMALFLEGGADINYVYEDANPLYPRTPLGNAVWNGRYHNVQFLLDRGADVFVDTERCCLSALARGLGEGGDLHTHQRNSYEDLTRILEERERKEMARRGFEMPQAIAIGLALTCTCCSTEKDTDRKKHLQGSRNQPISPQMYQRLSGITLF